MNPDQNPLDLLDDFALGKLAPEQMKAVEERMQHDDDFRRQAEQHLQFIEAFRRYGLRKNLKATLDAAHDDYTAEADHTPVVPLTPAPVSRWKRYRPLTAVAASVALVSILGTLYMTRTLETKQTAYYRELRRTVDLIEKSQKRIMADMARKSTAHTAMYAGSGFLISADGYVATSNHVVRDNDSIFLENDAFGRLKACVVYNDVTNDVAILRIESDTFKTIRNLPFIIRDDEANLGETVFTLGFPRDDIVFGEGSVSATTGFQSNPNAYQVSVPVNPGNSGGPLFNERGDLVGIISGQQTETSGAAFAIKSSVLLEAIRAMPTDSIHQAPSLSRQNALRNFNKVQRIRRWKDYVFMVRVYNH